MGHSVHVCVCMCVCSFYVFLGAGPARMEIANVREIFPRLGVAPKEALQGRLEQV